MQLPINPNHSQLKQVIMKTDSKVTNIPIWRNTSLENLDGEVWKPIVGFENLYKCSSMGRIKSKFKTVAILNSFKSYPEKIILQQQYKSGYLYHSLCKDGIVRTKLPHRLIAKTFLDNPHNKPEVNHKNGVKSDNRLVNLEWNTRSENQKHSITIGLRSAKGVKNSQSKLSKNEVLEIRNKIKKGFSGKKLSEKYGVSQQTISNIKSKYSWAHI